MVLLVFPSRGNLLKEFGWKPLQGSLHLPLGVREGGALPVAPACPSEPSGLSACSWARPSEPSGLPACSWAGGRPWVVLGAPQITKDFCALFYPRLS